jgi:hypothetical protein
MRGVFNQLKKNCILTILVTILFLSAACASEPEPEPEPPVPEGPVILPKEMWPVPAVTDMHNSPDIPWIWYCAPRDGHPVFITSSGLRAVREEEKTYGLQSAAVQAAQFRSISGSYERLSRRHALSFGRMESSEVFFSQESALELYTGMEVLEEYTDNRGTYLLTTHPEMEMEIDFTPEFLNGEPVWVTSPPRIPGYITAVGVAKMHRTFPDSLAAADEAAFLEMLNTVYGVIETETLHHSQTTEGSSRFSGSSSIQVTSEGEIRGFYILARWRDSRLNYYSLAVCPAEGQTPPGEE